MVYMSPVRSDHSAWAKPFDLLNATPPNNDGAGRIAKASSCPSMECGWAGRDIPLVPESEPSHSTSSNYTAFPIFVAQFSIHISASAYYYYCYMLRCAPENNVELQLRDKLFNSSVQLSQYRPAITPYQARANAVHSRTQYPPCS